MRNKRILTVLAILGAIHSACSGGGGGSSSTPVVRGKSVYWTTPQSFTDNTPLVPSRDLQGYEIYIKQDSSFGPADNAVATALPGENSFDLETLDPPLSKGVTYHAAVRAVPLEGEKSDFSSTVSFSLPK